MGNKTKREEKPEDEVEESSSSSESEESEDSSSSSDGESDDSGSDSSEDGASDSDDDSDSSDSEDDDGETVDTLRVNKTFEQQFNQEKRREELKRKNNLLAIREEQEIHSDSESEDEEAELLNAQLDRDIHATLLAIKNKDPRIYDAKAEFYHEAPADEDDEKRSARKQQKKEKNWLVEAMMHDGSDDTEMAPAARRRREEEAAKRAFRQADGSDDKDDDEDEDLFSVKIVGAAHEDKEKLWGSELADYFESDEALDEKEAWLKHFFTEDQWRRGQMLRKDPKLEGDEDEAALGDLEAEDDFLLRQNRFEAEHNFRFQEEGGDEIQRHARDQPESMRRVDDRRKKERERKKQRKAAERTAMDEEVKRLKKEKRRQMDAKMAELKQALDDDAAVDLDAVLEGDGELTEEQLEKVAQTLFGDDDNEESVRETFSALEKDLDELRQLDFEDVVGGRKMRFNYVPVRASGYGMTAEQIIEADNKTLAKHVSMKKLAPYREDADYIAQNMERRANHRNKKKRLRQLQQPQEEEEATQKNDDNAVAEPARKKRRQQHQQHHRNNNNRNKNNWNSNNRNNTRFRQQRKPAADGADKSKNKRTRTRRGGKRGFKKKAEAATA